MLFTGHNNSKSVIFTFVFIVLGCFLLYILVQYLKCKLICFSYRVLACIGLVESILLVKVPFLSVVVV